MSLAEATNDDTGTENADGVTDDTSASSDSGDQGNTAESQESGNGAGIEWGDAYTGEDGQPDLAKIHERLTAADAAPEGVPESVHGYDLALSDSIELTEGQAIEFSRDDPLVTEFLNDAHKSGKSQEQVSAELTRAAQFLKANFEARNKATKDAIDAAIEKIGRERITAAHNALAGLTSADDATALLENISTSAGFEAVERLLTKANGGGGGRTPADGSGGNDRRSTAERLYPQYSKGNK